MSIMRKIIYNMGYFFAESKKIIQSNLMSNVLTVISIGLIFFIFSMVITGLKISNRMMEIIQKDAEIQIHYDDKMSDDKVEELLERIKGLDGVLDTWIVDEEEAYRRMEDVLGKEADILKLFDENPFSPFIEAKIDLAYMDSVFNKLEHLEGVQYIRDNREILERIKNISGILGILGSLIAAAVAVSTFITVSHIIRQGIYNNREQINTLRLLGAPEPFIGFPFMLEGLILTLAGGLLTAILTVCHSAAFYSATAS